MMHTLLYKLESHPPLIVLNLLFFSIVNIFSASTYRWKVMINTFDPLSLNVVTKLSETRWSALHDAISALFDGYSHIKLVLFQGAENLEQKIVTKASAKGFSNKINDLGLTVLLCFRKVILERFHKKQSKLQRSDIILNSICEVCSSLKEYAMSKRGKFEAFLKEVITLCRNESYTVSRKRKKRHPADG